MKRNANRMLARFALLCIAVIFGAIAVAQANRGLRDKDGQPTVPGASDVADATGEAVSELQSPAKLVPIETGSQMASVPPNELDQWVAPAATAPAATESPADTSVVALPAQYADPIDPGHASDDSHYEMPLGELPIRELPESDGDSVAVAKSGADPGESASDAPVEPAHLSPDPYAVSAPPAMPHVPEFDAAPYPSDPPPVAATEMAEPRRPAYHAALGEARSVPESTPRQELDGVDDSHNYGDALVQLGDERMTDEVAPSQLAAPDQGRNLLDAYSDHDVGDSRGNVPIAASGTEGSGKPGPVELEGPQTPSLTLEKTAPREIQVGKPATFTIKIRNIGQTAAHEVLLRDEVPHGTRLIDTTPTSTRTADGAILWQMGTLSSGAEVTATMQVMPVAEGEIGSVATVSFQASASARSISTRPQLVIEHSTAREVLVGDDVIFSIKISNPGSGIATNIVVEEDVPVGLRHSAGSELEFDIGTLRPGETRHLELLLKADKPGLVQNLVVARGEGNLVARDECEIQVVAPQLEVGIRGPARRYLERKATYEVMVANQGTAPAHDVELVAYLPRGMKFVNTNNSGHYDSSRHAVFWNLAELPSREMGSVELTALPTEMGEQKIRVEGKAQMGLTDNAEQAVLVEGLAALLFNVKDVADPIEVGSQTTYEVHVVNQGSKTATNLRLAAEVPEGMQPISGEGPTRVTIDGQRVFFEPLARLAPQADTLYKIHVEGLHSGDKRFRVQMISDDVTEPVTKEESTRVYDDE